MIFRQLFDRESCTYTYLIGDEKTRKAVLIDPVDTLSERDIKILTELDLDLKYILETHIHADHITGIAKLKEHFPNAKSNIASQSQAEGLDRPLEDGDLIQFGEVIIQAIYTPGHTDTCMSYYLQDRVFTGDTLLIRGCGRTDFQAGSAEQLYDSITEKLFTLPDETWVYPGHNYHGHLVSTIGEEKQNNPRLSGKSKAAFVEIMDTLNLDKPKKIEEAVPANLKCGKI